MKTLYLNINNTNNKMLEVGKVKKCDSVKLEIALLEGIDYSNAEFRLIGNKADKNKVEQKDNYILEDDKITFTLNKQFLTCPGIVKMELNIVDDKEEYTTTLFYIHVSNTLNSEIVKSIEDVETLKDLENYINNSSDVVERVNKVAESLESTNQAIIPVEEDRVSNELVRKQDEKFRTAAEKDRIEAEKLRNTNEEDRINTEEERVLNEETRKNNELNRKTAENLRVKKEDAREQAEVLRQELFEENESVRNENENTRIVSENKRVQAEKLRQANEEDRILQEEARNNKEDIRESNEATRIEAERIREQQEANREDHYRDFNEAEETRKQNERNREAKELERVEAENSRNEKYENAEEERQRLFVEAENNRTRIYNVAENERAENERNRTVEEGKRKANEEARTKAEKLREQAEETRKEYHNSLIEAEEQRIESEKNREIKEQERQDYIENTVKPKVAEIDEFDIKLTKKIEKVYQTINDGSFIPFDGTDITVDNSKEGYTKDTILKGQTYQNLIQEKSYLDWTTRYCGRVDATGVYIGKGEKYANQSPDQINQTSSTDVRCSVLTKPNTVYTLIFDANILEGESSTYKIKYNGICNYGISPITNGRNTIKITSGDNPAGYFQIYQIEGEDSNINIKLTNIIILEGDWTNKEVPSSITGIESVGEKENNKISILSRNKNLFDIDRLSYTSSSITGLVKDKARGRVEISYKDKSSYPYVSYELTDEEVNFIRGKKILIKSDLIQYDSTLNHSIQMFATKADGSTSWITNGATTPMNVKTVRLQIHGHNNPSSVDVVGGTTIYENIYIGIEEMGDTYIPQKINKKEILLPLDGGLKSLPNGTCDTIEQRDDGVYLVQRIEKVAYAQGDENLENCITDKTVSYKAKAIPSEIKLNIDTLNLETFKEVTYISSENNIKPTLSFKAPVDVPATISSLRIKNNYLEKENKELKEDVEVKTNNLHEQDMEIVNSNLDLDFRLFELEMLIEDSMESSINLRNMNVKGANSMARTPYEMMKILILNNNYDREDIEYKASKYLKGNRITQAEYDELISLMDANEIVK